MNGRHHEYMTVGKLEQGFLFKNPRNKIYLPKYFDLRV